MYPREITSHQALGTRKLVRYDGKHITQYTGCDADASAHCRAPLWHYQNLDGIGSFFNTAAQERSHGDELACTGLQPSANDEYDGDQALNGGHTQLSTTV